MLIYRGKVDWYSSAVDEAFTMILPGPEFAVGAPAIAAWQWTIEADGTKKGNSFQQGTIDGVYVTETAECRLSLHHNDFKYYRFQATFSQDRQSLTVVMSNPTGTQSTPKVLMLDYSVPTSNSSIPRYFLGKMNWPSQANNEMLLVIFPNGWAAGSDVLAYWEWSADAARTRKVNHNFKDVIRSTNRIAVGQLVSFGTSESTYIFDGMISVDGIIMSLTMKNTAGTQVGPFTLVSQT